MSLQKSVDGIERTMSNEKFRASRSYNYKNMVNIKRRDSCRNTTFDSTQVPNKKISLMMKSKTHEENRLFNAGIVASVEGGFSIVPFFKKTSLPLNSKNLKWSINKTTRQPTFTRRENFASPKWLEPPSKSALPAPPTSWLLPRADFDEGEISLSSTWTSCSSGLGSSLQSSDDSFYSALSDLEKVSDENDCDSFQWPPF